MAAWLCFLFTLGCLFQEPESGPEPTVTGYELVFRGNEAFTEDELEKAIRFELEDLEKFGYRQAEVDDAAFSIGAFYRRQGFSAAQVDYLYEIEDEILRATFEIQEGPRTLLTEVVIEGVTVFPQAELHSFFLTDGSATIGQDAWFVESAVRSSRTAILSLYRVRGYMDAEVSEPEITVSEDKTRAQVRVTIVEGVQYFVREIKIAGYRKLTGPEVEASVQPLIGEPYQPAVRLQVRGRIAEVYANRGYPDMVLDVERTEMRENGDVVLAVSIDEGPLVRIAKVEIEGQDKTKESFIRKRVALKEGEVYRNSAEAETFRKLFGSGLFQSVETELVGEGSERNFLVRVLEDRSFEVYGAPGWGSYERARAEVGVRETNLFGEGKVLGLRAEASTVGYAGLLNYQDPWIGGGDYTLDVPVYARVRQEPSYKIRDLGVGLSLSTVSGAWYAAAGYQLSKEALTDVDTVNRIPLGTESDILSTVYATVRHDTRNDYFNPSAGHQVWVAAYSADKILGSDRSYFNMDFGFLQYFALGEGTNLALAYRTAFVFMTRDDGAVPLQKRLYNGGENTVRSFRESQLGPKDIYGNPIGGEARNVLNLELRQHLVDNLYAAAFTDFGNVGYTTGDYFDGFRSGVGVGLRYLLPVGALRVDAAYNPSARPGENTYVFQFSVGTAF